MTARWTTIEGAAMGSRWQAVVADAPAALRAWIPAELRRLESAWTRFDPTSELRRAEVAAAGRWAPISPTLAGALDAARRLGVVTGGIFDVTVGTCLDAIGYDRTFRDVAADDPSPVCPRPATGSVELDLDGPALRLGPGTRLDLGGLGKGLAADLVVVGALERGATSACVGVGGDVRVGGVAPSGGWVIPLADPTGGADRRMCIDTGGLVTSTTTIRRWRRAGCELHHLVHPASGRPAATGVRAVIATAAEAWWAEGVAKAALIAGPVAAPDLMVAAGVAGWLVDDAGTWAAVGRSA